MISTISGQAAPELLPGRIDLRLDHMQGTLSSQRTRHFFSAVLWHLGHRWERKVRCVGGNVNIVHTQQGIVRIRGLLLLDVEGCTRDPALAQGTKQRLFIDHRATRGVEAGCGLHLPQQHLIDQVAGFGVEQAVD